MLLLAEIEPFRHLSREEVIQLFDKGLISDVDLRKKLNFNTYIRRFERENMNILNFGAQIPFSKKIDTINETLARYADESLTK
jgi:hypothetical protein